MQLRNWIITLTNINSLGVDTCSIGDNNKHHPPIHHTCTMKYSYQLAIWGLMMDTSLVEITLEITVET